VIRRKFVGKNFYIQKQEERERERKREKEKERERKREREGGRERERERDLKHPKHFLEIKNLYKESMKQKLAFLKRYQL
jgi:hypothetical protein